MKRKEPDWVVKCRKEREKAQEDRQRQDKTRLTTTEQAKSKQNMLGHDRTQ